MEKDLLVCFANVKGFMGGYLRGFDYCIAIGEKLDDVAIDAIKDSPTSEYRDLYERTNKQLHEPLFFTHILLLQHP